LAIFNKEYSESASGLHFLITPDINKYISHASIECMKYIKARRCITHTSGIPCLNIVTNIDDLERVTNCVIKYKNSEVIQKLLSLATTVNEAEKIFKLVETIRYEISL
jgi:hypothetical protein